MVEVPISVVASMLAVGSVDSVAGMYVAGCCEVGLVVVIVVVVGLLVAVVGLCVVIAVVVGL